MSHFDFFSKLATLKLKLKFLDEPKFMKWLKDCLAYFDRNLLILTILILGHLNHLIYLNPNKVKYKLKYLN